MTSHLASSAASAVNGWLPLVELSLLTTLICFNSFLLWLQRLLGEHEEVHLSALGMAVSTMVSIAEILKKDGLAVETRKRTAEASTQRLHCSKFILLRHCEGWGILLRCGAAVCLPRIDCS
jgi:hypothetical protein